MMMSSFKKRSPSAKALHKHTTVGDGGAVDVGGGDARDAVAHENPRARRFFHNFFRT